MELMLKIQGHLHRHSRIRIFPIGALLGMGMQSCGLRVLGCAGVAFMALAGGSKNLETYLYLPGAVWIIGGMALVGWWAYQMYCVKPTEHK
jgi:hypothetical protein